MTALLLQLPIVVPILYCVIVLFIVAVPLITKPLESASGLAMMLGTGLPYFLLAIVWTNKPTSVLTTAGSQVTGDFILRLMSDKMVSVNGNR